MPQVRQFKSGSVIFFDGEYKDNNVYLLKSGVCSRTKVSPSSRRPELSNVQIGEFFGIKSALGNFPRDETIQVIKDSLVYEFSQKEFESVIKSKVSIIFKMLKAFSNELRKIHIAIDSILTRDTEGEEAFDQSAKLMYIGNYYYSNKAYEQAQYAFKKFIIHNSSSIYIDEVNTKLKEIESIINFRKSGKPVAKPKEVVPSDTGLFKLCESEESLADVLGADSMISSFNELLSEYKKGNFQKCYKTVKQLHFKIGTTMPEGELYERIFMTECRLAYYNQEYKKAIELVKAFAGRYKKSKWLYYTLLIMAECYSKIGSEGNAKVIYNKIVVQEHDKKLIDYVKGKL